MYLTNILRPAAAAGILALFATGASANPADLNAIWSAMGNNSPGDLYLIQASDNSVSGSIYGDNIEGIYIPDTRRLVFARLTSSGTPFQLFEAHVSTNGLHMAGSLIVWNGSGGGGQGGLDFNFNAKRSGPIDPPGESFRLDVVKQRGNGRITSTPTGIDCGNGSPGQCSATFAAGTTVKLFAKPSTSYFTSFWSDDCPNEPNPNTSSVTMNGDRLCSVAFERSDL